MTSKLPLAPVRGLPHSPLTTRWQATDERIEGVEFLDEEAAWRFDLERTIGLSGRQAGGDVPDPRPWFASLSWEEAERWLREGLP